MSKGHRSQYKRTRNEENRDTRPSAKLSYARVPVQKACFVLDAIRGKDVATALGIVSYNPRYASSVIKKILESAIANAQKEIPGIHADYTITGNRPYIEKDENSPLLALLSDTCHTVTGQPAVVSYFPGYTDTAVIAGTLHNHNCMSYGPGNLECAHQPDEWVSIEDIVRCEKVYKKLADSLW